MKTRFCISLLAGTFFCLSVSSLLAGKEYADSQVTEFRSGGDITIRLSAGEHKISASPDNQIHVRWQVGDIDDIEDVDARTAVYGSSAIVELDGPRRKFKTEIEVPRDSDLTIRLSAGDLRVGNVGGNRDIRLRAGDLNIEVGDSAEYSRVEGSLWAGDISAGPFEKQASGLFRSMDWRGDGKQELVFKLYAGDVEIFQAKD